jgi:single-strand DNA-binding protein
MNRATVYGRLAHTPELKSLPNGNKVATMSVATNHVYYDANKQKVENTDWHNIVAWGKQAETLAQYCEGGQMMLFSGRMVTRSWDDKKDGTKRYRTEIIVDEFNFGERAKSRQDGGSAQRAPRESKPVVEGKGYDGPELDTIDYGDANINIDDIPF